MVTDGSIKLFMVIGFFVIAFLTFVKRVMFSLNDCGNVVGSLVLLIVAIFHIVWIFYTKLFIYANRCRSVDVFQF